MSKVYGQQRLSLVLAAALLAIVCGSLFFGLTAYITADEPHWLLRYDTFVEDPLALPDEVTPLAGMANRTLVGWPGHVLAATTGIAPLAAYRIVQLTLFLGFAGLGAFWLSGVATREARGRIVASTLVMATVASVPLVLSMARVVNYDTVSSLFSFLAVVAAARAVAIIPGQDESEEPQPASSAGLWWLVSGLCVGVSTAAKGYGAITAVYLAALLVVVTLLAAPLPRNLALLARRGLLFLGGLAVGAIAVSPPLWINPAAASLYGKVLIGVNVPGAGAVVFAAGAAIAVLAMLLWASWRLRLPPLRERIARRAGAGLGILFLLLALYAVLDQKLLFYMTDYSAPMPVENTSAHIRYSFGSSNVWGERAANFGYAGRALVYSLPEHILLLLGGISVGALLPWRQRQQSPLHVAAVVLAAYGAFYVGTLAMARVMPMPRYNLPAMYALAGIAGLGLVWLAQQRPRWTLAWHAAAFAPVIAFMAAAAPHYHGYVNVLRAREAENAVAYGAWQWVWQGWGEGVGEADAWLRERFPQEAMPTVVADYIFMPPGRNFAGHRNPLKAYPRYDYYLFTKINSHRMKGTAKLLNELKPIFTHDVLGADSAYLYSREQIRAFLQAYPQFAPGGLPDRE